MRPGSVTLRAAALMAATALALHELRYLLGGQGLDQQGHGYLSYAGVAAGLLLALAAGQLVARIARAWRDGESESRGRSFVATWMAATVGLLLVYGCQELLEGAPVLGHGGAWAVPLALALGGLAALALVGAGAAVRAVAALADRHRRAFPRRAKQRVPRVRDAFPPASPIARHLAGRAPPLLA